VTEPAAQLPASEPRPGPPQTAGEPANPIAPPEAADPVTVAPGGTGVAVTPGRPNGGNLPRRRLHPLTPLLKGAKMLTVAVAAISWQGFSQLGFLRWLVVVAGILVATLVLAAVSWLVTGFEVVGRELRIYEGLIWRRTRSIPLERVQAIDLNRPLLARLTGVAELRLEVIGAAKTEAPLAFLTVAEATELRRRLLALPSGATVAEHVTDEPVETPIHTVDNKHVLLANLLSPPVLFVPVALLVTGASMINDPPAWSVIGVASAATGLFGVVLPPLRRIFAQWNFRISVDDSGLRLRHGLVETRSQTVPPLRVQAVAVTRPLLWRPFGWVRTKLDVAGYGGDSADQGVRGSVLLPVADWATTRRVIARVLDGVDIDELPLRPVPDRARFVSPLARRKRSFGQTATVVAARDGWLTDRLVVATLARIQSVRVVQGPVQRRLGLANVHVDTAGGLHAVGRDRDAVEAYGLAGDLAESSRSARSGEGAGPASTDRSSPAEDPGPAGDRRDDDLDRHQRSATEQSKNASPTYTQPTSTSIT
jgi:putative membrane protein